MLVGQQSKKIRRLCVVGGSTIKKIVLLVGQQSKKILRRKRTRTCPGIIGSVVILTHMLESNWSGSLYDVLRPRQVAQVAQTAHVGQSSGRRRGNRRRRRKPIMDIIYLPSIRSQLRAVIGSAITLTFGCSPEGCVRA